MTEKRKREGKKKKKRVLGVGYTKSKKESREKRTEKERTRSLLYRDRTCFRHKHVGQKKYVPLTVEKKNNSEQNYDLFWRRNTFSLSPPKKIQRTR